MPLSPSSALNVAMLALAIGVVGGCGGQSGTTANTTAQTGATPAQTGATPAQTGAAGALKIAADPSGGLKFDVSSLTAKAGKVTIDFTNQAPLAHNVQIEGPGGKQLGGTSTITGSSTKATVDLKPGTYTFYCSVDGHRQAGMQGKLTVK
jgi:plastocyanin